MADGSTSAEVSLLYPLGLMPAGPVFGLSSATYPRLTCPDSSNGDPYAFEVQSVTFDASTPRLQVRNQIAQAREDSLRALLGRVSEAGMAGVLNVEFDCEVRLETVSTWGMSFRASGQGVRRVPGSEGGAVFSATFGAADLLLLAGRGLAPLEVVVASEPTAHQWDLGGWTPTELSTLTHTASRARHKAVKELQRVARTVKADGVLGIELQILGGGWIEPSHEHLVFGTAVRRINPSRPLSDERKPAQMILALETGDCSV